ncbi:hypothetical protein VM1G_08896 [Cytospora mali]|uniref:Uncharacterized protein n=1 Tax=Cytospora mali TaxID=578113 RepID=A0A194WAN7_CYTMA|nr:hypothetical protein VM1G_08896 [Valsa mali]
MDGKNHFIPEHNLYFVENPHLRWPCWKFGMKLNDIFTTLPEQFNTMTIPICDPNAFYKDAAGLSYIAKDRAQFLELLAQRRNLRYEEMTTAWSGMLRDIISHQAWLGTQVHDVMRFCHYTEQIYTFQSFDSLISFFGAFAPPELDNDHLIKSNNPASAQLIDAASQPTTPIRASSSSAASGAHSERAQNNTTNPTSSHSVSAQPINTTSQPTTPLQTSSPPVASRRQTEDSVRSAVSSQHAGVRGSCGSKSSGVRDRRRRVAEKAPRRSSRLREKRESHGHRVGYRPSTAQAAAATSGPKRKRGLEESHDVQPIPNQGGSELGPKRRKTDTATRTPQVASGSKRKRGPEESHDVQTIPIEGTSEPGSKRRKADTTPRTPQVASGSKTKRGPEESHKARPTTTQRAREPGLKRRKPSRSVQSTVSPGFTSTTSKAGDQQQKRAHRPSISPRITQTHQPRLSEEDAGLFRHGQRGEQDVEGVQGTANDVDGDTGPEQYRSSSWYWNAMRAIWPWPRSNFG